MAVPWPSEEARERYIRFLQLERKLEECAEEERIDPEVLGEMDELLKRWFPRTSELLLGRRKGERDTSLEKVRSVAWAEARAVSGEGDRRKVEGSWTEKEIRQDINECLLVARERDGD